MKIADNLTVVILTKNEEKNIVDVVQNAAQVTDDILIIDSGSTDKTVELAKQENARVVYRAWDNDFAAQRNFAFEHTNKKWILYLDADERLNDELVEAIKSVVNSSARKQYSILRKIHAFGFKYKHGIFKPDEVLRMFPTNGVKWEHKVHERPICALPKERLSGFIEHYTYDSWQQWWDKAGHYTSIWAQDNYAKGKRTTLAACLAHSIYGFIRAYFIQLGFVDGWSGLYSSFQHSIYTMMKYLKLYELNQKE